MLRLQPTLPGLGLGGGRLFAPPVLDRYLREHATTRLPGDDAGAAAIEDWVTAVAGSSATETTLDPQFVERILCGVLGYTAHPASPASLFSKPPPRITHASGVPDVVLGDFDATITQCTVVVELKSPGTDLDRPQPGYENRTAVDQAFDYARKTFQARWVIVSDMLVIRLYAVESQDDFEEFDLRRCVGEGTVSEERRRRLLLLLHNDYLNRNHDQSQVSLLYEKSASQRVEARAGFYQAYCSIRTDLYQAIQGACAAGGMALGPVDLLHATQRLLDRLMFIYYCEDHPQGLIRNGTVESVVEAASRLPGPGSGKIYEHLKLLFREVDEGSAQDSGLSIAAYNGELFKEHPVIDRISLPDSLNKLTYATRGVRGATRTIRGVWGLHVYDFWTELNEHLMGHIFEESLSDLEALVASSNGQALKWQQRKQHGVFFTTDILSDFLARNVLTAALEDGAPRNGARREDTAEALEARIGYLCNLRIVDFACGSGAFLVSAYREMVRELWRLSGAMRALAGPGDDLFSVPQVADRSEAIRECVFGVDILPQAVEIAKLALWLNSVRKDEPVNDLSRQIVVGDSLDVADAFARLGSQPLSFDIVIGNPPWGGQVEPAVYAGCLDALGLSTAQSWDTWELFLLLALRALREGGRLALLVPDSFFYPEKAKTRRLLFEAATVEMVYSLGADWFGSEVRMGTVALQARRGEVDAGASLRCMALSGELRRDAIRAKVPLTQVESLRGRQAPLRRTLESPSFEVEVFRGARDDRIMAGMEAHGIALHELCSRARGEEINKAGLAWRCPNCQNLTTPGAKLKGGGYAEKPCPHCGLKLQTDTVQESSAVSDGKPSSAASVGFMDGDDIATRYARVVPNKTVAVERLVDPKPETLYAPPKLLIREAGVGLSAAFDETPSRCPRSVYVYRLRGEYVKEGYHHEYVLAALLSRALNYYVLKRYGETDPAKAYAKLRHEHLSGLPIPRVDFSDRGQARAHEAIVANVRKLLAGTARNGGPEDLQIEAALRRLWGIAPEDGAYINGEFYDLPRGQVVASLFPDGPPSPIRDSDTEVI